ncbi:MAG: hypothetical protein Tsb0020_12900 [Haliangiales bacterium]
MLRISELAHALRSCRLAIEGASQEQRRFIKPEAPRAERAHALRHPPRAPPDPWSARTRQRIQSLHGYVDPRAPPNP